jgi:hypothetical protein
MINPSNTARSVVAMKRVRRLKRQAIHGITANEAPNIANNPYGTITRQ